jgi:hypothetical protein
MNMILFNTIVFSATAGAPYVAWNHFEKQKKEEVFDKPLYRVKFVDLAKELWLKEKEPVNPE